MSRSSCFTPVLIRMPHPDHFPIMTARFMSVSDQGLTVCPRPSRSRGQQMEADEPQMAKSTTTTPLALLPGSRPWTQGRPLLESLVGG